MLHCFGICTFQHDHVELGVCQLYLSTAGLSPQIGWWLLRSRSTVGSEVRSIDGSELACSDAVGRSVFRL